MVDSWMQPFWEICFFSFSYWYVHTRPQEIYGKKCCCFRCRKFTYAVPGVLCLRRRWQTGVLRPSIAAMREPMVMVEERWCRHIETPPPRPLLFVMPSTERGGGHECVILCSYWASFIVPHELNFLSRSLGGGRVQQEVWKVFLGIFRTMLNTYVRDAELKSVVCELDRTEVGASIQGRKSGFSMPFDWI